MNTAKHTQHRTERKALMTLMLMAQITAQTMVMQTDIHPLLYQQALLINLPLLQAMVAILPLAMAVLLQAAMAAVFRFPLLATLLTKALALPQEMVVIVTTIK